MVLLKKCLSRINPYFNNHVQLLTKGSITSHFNYSNVSASQNFADLELKPKFSDAEQEKILSALNKKDTDHLLSLRVSQSKIKCLENYKKKNGQFTSIDELLEVDGLGLKVSEKLCRQIISEAISDSIKKLNNNANKKTKHFFVPPLAMNESQISSVVGIHLAPIGISWAKLLKCENEQNELDCWGYLDFINLPKKLLPTDTFKLALNTLKKLPVGDVYAFEGSSSLGIGMQGQKQPAAVTSYTQQMELSSMLLSLINTNSTHNIDFKSIEKSDDKLENKVYFLRSKLPARLFKTLVGNECVSSTSTVLQLLDSYNSDNFTLPCSPIFSPRNIKDQYLSASPAHKELLGHALLLTVAFTELCILKNPTSIHAVAPGKKNHV